VPDAKRSGDQSSQHRATIILVEDNDDVREITALLLSNLNYKVVQAANATSALRALEGGAKADLLMVDLGLPDMSGSELAARARALWTSLRVLYVTGSLDPPAARMGNETFIRKPFTFKQMAEAISDLLSAPDRVPAANGGPALASIPTKVV
jgi:CheY-like chemotaxis protein